MRHISTGPMFNLLAYVIDNFKKATFPSLHVNIDYAHTNANTMIKPDCFIFAG